MNWSKEFSSTEIFFIVFFAVVYLIYFARIFIISKKLNTSSSSVAIKFVIRASYFSLMIIGLLGPNFGLTETEARSSAKEIYIAFDLSTSMNANDVEPSRLDRAKSESTAIIDLFTSDKIGLIVFDEEAYIITPLTYDHEILKSNINSLKTSLLKKGGTNFNNLFSLIYDKFNLIDLGSGQSKVCVVFTDGENFGNINNRIFSSFKKQNINMFFMAVGSSSGSKIPQLRGFKKDKFGNDVITTMDIKQVSELAKKFNGKYFTINNKTNQAADLSQNINAIKKTGQNLSQQLVTYNKYFYFLLLALILISVDLLFTVNVLKL